MILVLTENHQQFTTFCMLYGLRDANRTAEKGYMRYISEPNMLRGFHRDVLCLEWGTPWRRRDYDEICMVLEDRRISRTLVAEKRR